MGKKNELKSKAKPPKDGETSGKVGTNSKLGKEAHPPPEKRGGGTSA